jgi:hypothetical protein
MEFFFPFHVQEIRHCNIPVSTPVWQLDCLYSGRFAALMLATVLIVFLLAGMGKRQCFRWPLRRVRWLSCSFGRARSRKRTGIPAGEVFYQDLVGQDSRARDLRSLKLGSSGKPGCLIRTADGIVPVELKHRSGHRLKARSIPITGSRTWPIVDLSKNSCGTGFRRVWSLAQGSRFEFMNFTRKWLIHTIAAVRAARLAKQAKRNHNQRGRCSGCGVRDK